jgi:MFS transporter, UMF1 family
LSYQLFEAADVSWYLIAVATFFPLFVEQQLHGAASQVGWTLAAAALVFALVSPLLGAACDARGPRKPYLLFFVLAATLLTLSVRSVATLPIGLLLFGGAFLCVNSSFQFYTALLPAVATRENVSRVASTAVAIGLIGGLCASVAMGEWMGTDRPAASVFPPLAGVYLCLALPALLFAPDFPRKAKTSGTITQSYRRLLDTARAARSYRNVLLFLIAYLLVNSVVACVIPLTGLYARNVLGATAQQLPIIFGPGLIAGALGSVLLFGPLADKFGPKPVMLFGLGLWLLYFATLAILKDKALLPWIVGPLCGLSIAATLATGRSMYAGMVPVESSAELWGLYALSDRFAGVLGNLVWASELALLGERPLSYVVTIVSLAALIGLSFFVVVRLENVRASESNFLVRQA